MPFVDVRFFQIANTILRYHVEHIAHCYQFCDVVVLFAIVDLSERLVIVCDVLCVAKYVPSESGQELHHAGYEDTRTKTIENRIMAFVFIFFY